MYTSCFAVGFHFVSISGFALLKGRINLFVILLKFSDVNRLTYSVLPRDNGVGEGSWAGLCFSPSQWSMVLHFSC
jgi:hypothetical protein